MGFLTTVTIYNDRLHDFKENPANFLTVLWSALDLAQFSNRSQRAEGGYIKVEPSRHADNHTLYIHSGNTVHTLGAYDQDFVDLVKSNPEVAKKWLNDAKRMIREAEEVLKTSQKELAKDK